MEFVAPLVLGAMLVVSVLVLAHNARRKVMRKLWLIPLLGFGPVGIPLVLVGALIQEHTVQFLSPAGTGLVLLAGTALCLAVWMTTVVGYCVFWFTRNAKPAAI